MVFVKFITAMRKRSAEYRARRKHRHAARRNRMSEWRDYYYILTHTPGYWERVERLEDVCRLADEWETHDTL